MPAKRPVRAVSGWRRARLGLAGGVVLALAVVLAALYWPRPGLEALDASTAAERADSASPIAPSGGTDSQAGPAAAPVVTPQETVFAAYGGSPSCKECHEQIYEEWAQSNHGMAERRIQAEMDEGAFDPPHRFRHGSQQSTAFVSNGVFQVTTLGLGGRLESYPVERVIGHDPLRQFLVRAPGDRFQVLEASYDPHRREWFNVYGDEDRRPGEWGHWTGRGMTWNSMCASCHNTRLRKNYDEATDSYHTAMVEMTVGCEACHGPMKEHVEWCRAHPEVKQAGPVPPPMTPKQMMDTCAPCHSRRYEVTGDFIPGDDYFDHYALTIVDGSDIYYADGQVREEDYEFASFLSSRMHARGVTCRDCHHPHTMQPILPGNLLCLRCHIQDGYPNAPVIDEAAHSFHKVDDSGGQCVNCHMPQTPYMQRHWRHDHMFSIPDPLLTKELGIPNACNRCHQDKDADWALAAVEKWYGPKMDRPYRERARVIAAARRGDPAGRDGLLALMEGDESPYWKASAVNLLDLWAAEPKVRRTLLASLSHSNALVRLQATRSLAPLLESTNAADVRTALGALLQDPVRSVRYQAAWGLRAEVAADSRAGRELQWALDFNADFPSGLMQKGAFALARGDVKEALVHYQKAVAWDAYSAPLRHELAVVLSMLGRNLDALEQMQEACRLAPNEAEYQFKLGLAWNELGQLDRTVAALEEAVRLNAGHARAWYNLGLAYQAQGAADQALDAFRRGELANPGDPGLPYTRATLLAQMGRLDAAREAAALALQIQPDFPAAQALLQSLPQP